MTDRESRQEDHPSILEDGRDVAGSNTSRFRPCREADPSEGARTLDLYDEGLERYFELSSWLALHRVHGEDGTDRCAALRAELGELDRELSELSRELSLSEIGTLLEESFRRDGDRESRAGQSGDHS